jgi:DNA-binding CsgD family transcriptional regulator
MKRLVKYAGLAFLLFAAFALYDHATADEPFDLAEFLLEDAPEWLLLAVAMTASLYAADRLRHTLAERDALASALSEATSEGDQWRAAARVYAEGFAGAIRDQFARWNLTAGESDVAMLLLKGLSHKEIARLRSSSSATVRQQATSVYAKSKLGSRAELAAYFLEDLFPSAPARHPPSGKSSKTGQDIMAKAAAADL